MALGDTHKIEPERDIDINDGGATTRRWGARGGLLDNDDADEE